MVKKLLLAVFISSFVTLSLAAPKEETSKDNLPLTNPKTTKDKSSTPSSSEPQYTIPDWVKRTRFAIEAGSDIKPTYFVESVQPLLGTQNNSTVLFSHSRISSRDYRTTFNTGIGARRIFWEKYLLGINTFYDFQDLHQHHRAGVGFEAISDRGLEARLNTYFRVSDIRQVREDANAQYFEKVASGLDWELGSPLPYLPFLRLYGGGKWYSFEKFHNKVGWNMRLEYNPVKNSRLVFEMLDDNKRSRAAYHFEGAFTLAFTSFYPKDILRDIKSSSVLFPKIDLSERTLDRVVRDFDITVITFSKTKGGLVVEGGKT